MQAKNKAALIILVSIRRDNRSAITTMMPEKWIRTGKAYKSVRVTGRVEAIATTTKSIVSANPCLKPFVIKSIPGTKDRNRHITNTGRSTLRSLHEECMKNKGKMLRLKIYAVSEPIKLKKSV
jgi:hypothetical protein